MKNLLLLTLLAVATIGANAATHQTPADAGSKQERKAARKAARQAKSPEVYKGTVAEQRRLLTDAAGSESDRDTGDKPSKSKKKSKE
ncbi:MAG: hypothetical protein ACRYG7_44125 [Janthinobacterium lividum]